MATPLRAFTYVLASTLDAVINSLATSRQDRRVRQSLRMNQPVVFEVITLDACRPAARSNCSGSPSR